MPNLQRFQTSSQKDLDILGASAFEGKAVDRILIAKITDLERSVERFSLLQAHDALCLLKKSPAIPKLQYIIRTSPNAGNPHLSTFGKVLRCGLSKMLYVNLNDTQWTQAMLPVYMSGLGVRSTFSFLGFSCSHALTPGSNSIGSGTHY